jgi:hypothetical protein
MILKIPVKLRLLTAPQTPEGIPITGHALDKDTGAYLGTVTGLLPTSSIPKKRSRGRPKNQAAPMRRYCEYLKTWANPVTNRRLIDKDAARARAATRLGLANDPEDVLRIARRDEKACRGALEVVLHDGLSVQVVIVFDESFEASAGHDRVRIIGPAWVLDGSTLKKSRCTFDCMTPDGAKVIAAIRSGPHLLAQRLPDKK